MASCIKNSMSWRVTAVSELTKQGLDVTRNPAPIECNSARLLLRSAARDQSASFGVSKIKITQLRDSLSLARCPARGEARRLLGSVASGADPAAEKRFLVSKVPRAFQ